MKAEMKIVVELPDKWINEYGEETDDYRDAAWAQFINNIDDYAPLIEFDVIAERGKE